MNGVPLNAMIGVVKRNLKQAVAEEKSKSGLPAYLIGAVLADIRADLMAEEITELINIFTSEGETEDDNANEQS